MTKSNISADVLVVGAGQAGAALVAKLRGLGFAGSIAMIGDETAPPYQRPPLSKAYLLGEMALERLYLRPLQFYVEHDITLITGAPVASINSAAKSVALKDGRTATYGRLVLATGSRARRLPAAVDGDLANVFTMRDLADADALAPKLVAGARMLVLGGGYIGLEAAAVAAKKGLKVTLVEMADRILNRVAAPETAAYFRALHQSHGVEIMEGTALKALHGTDNLTTAEFADGARAPFDVAVIGIGIAPNDDLAKAAGLAIENGIKTDAFGATTDPDIYATGDCASFPHAGVQARLESVGHAIDHGELVAANLMGAGKPYAPKPWFWSDQYDVKLQIAGLSQGFDTIVTRRGDAAPNGPASFWYYRAGQLIACDAMNDPRAYMVAKRLIEGGQNADPAIVGDVSSDLKSLMVR